MLAGCLFARLAPAADLEGMPPQIGAGPDVDHVAVEAEVDLPRAALLEHPATSRQGASGSASTYAARVRHSDPSGGRHFGQCTSE
jgi:hypothetical protein